jgi:hypothetical protein
MIATIHERAEDANLAVGLVVSKPSRTRSRVSMRRPGNTSSRGIARCGCSAKASMSSSMASNRAFVARTRLLVLAEPDVSLEQEVRDEREILLGRERTPDPMGRHARCA